MSAPRSIGNSVPLPPAPARSGGSSEKMVSLSIETVASLINAGGNKDAKETSEALATILQNQPARQQLVRASLNAGNNPVLAPQQRPPQQPVNYSIVDGGAPAAAPLPSSSSGQQFIGGPQQQQQQQQPQSQFLQLSTLSSPNAMQVSKAQQQQQQQQQQGMGQRRNSRTNTNPISTNTAQTRPPPRGQSVIEVVSFNVLNHIHYERHCKTPHKMPFKDRMARLLYHIEVVADNPGVAFICLQELNPNQMRAILDLLVAKGFFPTISTGGPQQVRCDDCVCVASRSSRFKAVGQPTALTLTNQTGATSTGKTALVQLFEDLQTHVVFAVASVHLFWESSDQQRRNRVVEMLQQVVSRAGGNYIIAGDFNINARTPSSAQVLHQTMTSIGWEDATDGLPWTAMGKHGGEKLDYVFFRGQNLRRDPNTPKGADGGVIPISDALLLRHEGNEPVARNQFPSDHAMVIARVMLTE